MAMAPRLMRSPATQQYLLGQGLQKQGLETTPIYSNTEGFARLAQALAGGLLQRDAQQKYEAQQAKDTAQLASLLGGAGVSTQLANLFASDVPGASTAAATLMAGEQAKELARIQAGGKAASAQFIDGNSPKGQALGIPKGQSAPVTFNASGEAIDIGKPIETDQKAFGGTSTSSAALQVLIGYPADSKEYRAAYAFLSRPETFTTPDGLTRTRAPMDLSGFTPPSKNGNQQPEAATPQPEPAATSDGEPSPPPLSEEKVEASPDNIPVTSVTTKIDEDYGKTELPEFRKESASAIVNLDRLENVMRVLEERDDITGPGVALTLKISEALGLDSALAPTAADTKNRLESVAQESIRQLMGAQFSENEGKQILQRAFDPSQQEGVNLQRVRELYNNLNTVLAAKQDQAQYFEKNGTLRGYKGPTREQLENLVRGKGGSTLVEPLKVGETTTVNNVTIERVN